jgi:hypothetical protein
MTQVTLNIINQRGGVWSHRHEKII